MRLAGTAAVTLSLVLPALAESGTGEGTGTAAPVYEYAAPIAPDGLRAKGNTAPGERQVPTPAPSGCPFRDGKLELIV
jgi:hypothetical protein